MHRILHFTRYNFNVFILGTFEKVAVTIFYVSRICMTSTKFQIIKKYFDSFISSFPLIIESTFSREK